MLFYPFLSSFIHCIVLSIIQFHPFHSIHFIHSTAFCFCYALVKRTGPLLWKEVPVKCSACNPIPVHTSIHFTCRLNPGSTQWIVDNGQADSGYWIGVVLVTHTRCTFKDILISFPSLLSPLCMDWKLFSHLSSAVPYEAIICRHCIFFHDPWRSKRMPYS